MKTKSTTASAPVRAGRANYAMGDGRVATYPYGKATCLENLSVVLPSWRSDAALCRPR